VTVAALAPPTSSAKVVPPDPSRIGAAGPAPRSGVTELAPVIA
jgi:hypothetical protein